MRLLLSLVFILVLTTIGQSQDVTKKEKIKGLFALMHQDSLIIKTFDAMTTSMVSNMTKIFSDTTYTNIGIDAAEISQRLIAKTMKKSKDNALNLLNFDMVDIYDKYFTSEEVDDFSNFYKSKSGQKLLTQMPNITKDIMTVMTTKYQSDFQQSLMKDVQEIIEQASSKQK